AISPEVFVWMRIEPPPQEGRYFTTLGEFAKDRLKLESKQKLKALDDLVLGLGKRPWTSNEHPEIAAWLAANQRPLSIVVEATNRSRYYFPMVPKKRADGRRESLTSSLLPTLRSCRLVGRALLARATLQLGENKAEDGWQDVLACHRLGRLVGAGACL